MSAVTTPPLALESRRTALGRFRTLALASALACTASGAYASFAAVSFSLSVTATGTDQFADLLFAPPEGLLQTWDLLAESGNLSNSNTGFAFDWNTLDRTAQIGPAKATYSFLQGSGPASQPTPGISLTATAPALFFGPLQSALTTGVASGGYCFYNSNTPFTNDINSCTGSGTLEFQLDYFLTAALVGPHGLASNASASVFLTGTDVPPPGFFLDQVLVAGLPLGGTTSKTGSFTWTANLSPGGFTSFAITGQANAQGIPEPSVLALAALGLLGLVATRRRKGPARTVA